MKQYHYHYSDRSAIYICSTQFLTVPQYPDQAAELKDCRIFIDVWTLIAGKGGCLDIYDRFIQSEN